MKEGRTRKWCFTAYKLDECLSLKDSNPEYICWGVEKCPTTQRIHYQGFIAYKNAKKLNELKKRAPTTHFEQTKGTVEQNIKYCSKDGEFIEHGERLKNVDKQKNTN